MMPKIGMEPLRRRALTEGKIYFPIFEHYLEMHGLPKQLKYLPMIESSMVPYAVSYAGAAGLWQCGLFSAGS